MSNVRDEERTQTVVPITMTVGELWTCDYLFEVFYILDNINMFDQSFIVEAMLVDMFWTEVTIVVDRKYRRFC